ncbi:MAG: hypothetical protein GY802_22375 [Gammaproteobacteria bacterium]|nr:hypothetical protein [Gammaproteobacteria bacterium]
MPKGADLHNHLGGASYGEYVVTSAVEQGLNYDPASRKFSERPAGIGGVITAEELIRDSAQLSAFYDASSMRGWFPATSNGHDHFFATFDFLRSGDRGKAEMLAEVVARNAWQNVSYLELMMSASPKSVRKAVATALTDFDPDNLNAAWAQVQAVAGDPAHASATAEYLDNLESEADRILRRQHDLHLLGNDPDVVVRYIPQLLRKLSLKRFFADAVAAMMAIRDEPRVVSLNMVQPEDATRSHQYFSTQMRILDFLSQRMGRPPITLHAGELVLRESPVEPMRDRISRSVTQGHARRIGHGISIAWEDDVVGTLETMRDQSVLVEICLSSNEGILGVYGDAHPFMLYRRAGVPVSINTDDEAISRSNLTMEFVIAASRYDLDYGELLELARNSLEYSFASGKGLYIEHDYKRLRAPFGDVRSANWTPSPEARELLAGDLKLRLQVRLERQIVAFERSLATGFHAH